MTMTLEQVRDELRRPWNQTSAFAWCAQLADAIDAHLSQPQPVAQGEAMSLAVALDFADNPRPYHSMQAPADTNGELYRALQVLAKAYRELAMDAMRYQWLRDSGRLETNQVIDRGTSYHAGIVWVDDLDASIDRAMLAAAPDAGGV